VGADQLFAREDAERAWSDPAGDGGGGAGAALTARAVAVAGDDQRLGHLEADAAAHAAAGQRELGHGGSLRCPASLRTLSCMARIELFYWEGCPSYPEAQALLEQAFE